MSKIPKKIADEVKKITYLKADEFGYLTSNATESSKFMANLVEDTEVGLVLKEYLEASKIKTYIKDAILHKYSATKNVATVLMRDPEALVKKTLDIDASSLKKVKEASILAYSEADNSKYIVCSPGTWLKWETALRKGLLTAASCNTYEKEPDKYLILLVLWAKTRVAESDVRLVERALSQFNVLIHLC